MRVLLTNDDGAGAEGIGAMRAALAGSCDRVITIAPEVGLEAAILGTPAVCLSQQTPTGTFAVNYREDLAAAYDFRFAAAHGAQLARSVVAARPDEPVVLNVNYPATGTGVASVLTRPGQRAYPQVAGDDGEVRLLYLFGAPDEEIPEADASPGTDIGALRAGYVSITPLASGVEAAGEAPPFGSFMARLTEEFPLGRPAG